MNVAPGGPAWRRPLGRHAPQSSDAKTLLFRFELQPLPKALDARVEAPSQREGRVGEIADRPPLRIAAFEENVDRLATGICLQAEINQRSAPRRCLVEMEDMISRRIAPCGKRLLFSPQSRTTGRERQISR